MSRFQHALRHELMIHWRNIIITSFAVAGAILVMQMVRWVREPVAFNLWSGYGLVMTVTGVIITTGMFGEMRSPGLRLDLLLRPAGALEKIGAKLAVATVFFTLAIVAAFFAASLTALLLYLLIGGRGEVLIFLDGGRWLSTAGVAFLDYLPVQAVFFFGAVYFRRNPGGRTLLALAGTFLVYGLITLTMARAVFNPFFTGRYSGHGAPRVFGLQLHGANGFIFDNRVWVHVVPGILQNDEIPGIMMRILVPLVFWALAVLRFRESEG